MTLGRKNRFKVKKTNRAGYIRALRHVPVRIRSRDGARSALPDCLPLESPHGGVVAVLDRVIGPAMDAKNDGEGGGEEGNA